MSLEREYYNGFKLISLKVKKNTLLSKTDNIKYDFLDDKDTQEKLYTTVLIGPNGTGKSNLFRIIIELLKEVYDLSIGNKRSYFVDGEFELKFSINGDVYEYLNVNYTDNTRTFISFGPDHKTAYLLKNNKRIEFNEIELPITIIANSIMLTDKFPVFNDETTFPNYKYLGLRNRPQSASTRSYVRKTIEFIVQQLDSSSFRKGLENATKFLGLGNSIEIFYYTSNTTLFFKGNLTPLGLAEYFEAIKLKYDKNKKQPPFKLNHYIKIMDNNDLIKRICDFCNELFDNNRLIKIDYSSVKKINYNIIDNETFKLLKHNFELLEHLRQLGMISAPEIQLKRASDYSLQESSSGEYHFFSSVVGLMATVKPNSLIFIDEPEVSLHPNWQMQYLSFIRKLFSEPEYSTCHLFVATHSHFLISDLKNEDSKIIGLKKVDNEIKIVELSNQNTYGWSAEDVLYNVFQVATTRNYYIAVEIGNILKAISKKNIDYAMLDSKKKELEEIGINLKPNDPLKSLVEKIQKEFLNN